ncbi:ABC transporter ATP-binding protein [Chryseobacterium rhizosphaerae]|uniref:ABC transporter ATP-binding protein n=1 Tax=Chryseobacterium rhizosphaerae TaxID=395937 RepID=A0ABX9IQI0_9FLAO|nr:polysaccharide ABC transporter ATP-binding protein [Chryseobacterium rhizosphaerae]MDR6544428.1 lipopolysaccharide transport system ATP-binding protein [Chryseobacterium rhizosphaerae]REC78174.1 ABC transporter ATP-binding protein [Chryseobacterium rhizosphaerae]GEN68901.1 ABC transporter ATP-binding protein [Chryseobacterium rhizosphaerae]
MLALKAENISKQYRLGQVGTGTLSHDLNRFWHKVRGKEDPYLKIGEANDRTTKGESEYVWSLRDINFEIEQGDAVGIIGRNGAGKSTLLKLLSKVTKPTTGKIYTNGRIASLLEVGTGFHPEMTGRENVFLNGAILGMTRKEIKSKFDEIVDFSGVERYIDTPVKRYSSGMYVRLAFAVAAHLESEILIVDEVLAVGDADFQKKCLGKMGDVTKGEGRTVLFVSHNILAVKKLCNKGIILENGQLAFDGNIDKAIKVYNSESLNRDTFMKWEENDAPGNSLAKILSIKAFCGSNEFNINEDITLEFDFINFVPGQKLNISFSVFTEDEIYVLSSPNIYRPEYSAGKHTSYCTIPKDLLNSGVYYISVLLVGENFTIITELDKIIRLELKDVLEGRSDYMGRWNGVVRPKLEWKND